MSEPSSDKNRASPHDLPTLIQQTEEVVARDKVQPDSSDPARPSTPIPTGAAGAPDSAQGGLATPLSRVGDYELLSELGRGGMGVVFKARDVRLNRIVALKMLSSSSVVVRPEDIQRFENEAAAAAQLQHPNIVALFEVGNYNGQPFFSMEFVDGSSLAQRVDMGVLPSRLAASYLERIARAVHFAHGRGVIHRDLKPANILLDEQDQPKITDFGLAKLVQSDSGQTRTGTVVGTPSYMAPEQASAQKNLTPACDVYSLGAILYELLTGHPPFIGETALATLHMVAYQDPVPPHLVNPKVDRDLETICLKCLEKEPSRRYASAEAFADDLRRHLKGEPISARRLGFAGRGWKWVRRKPGPAAALLITLAALIGFGIFEWRVAVSERVLREEAEKQKKHAEAAQGQILQREQLLRHFFYLGQMQQAWQAWNDADLARATNLLRYWRELPAKKDLRDWEWHFLNGLLQGKRTLQGHTKRVRWLAYNHKGTLLASAGGPALKAGEVKIWRTATGKLLKTLPVKHRNIVTQVAFSPDDSLLATASADGTVRLWNTRTWQETAVLKEHKKHVNCVAFSPDGKYLLSAGGDACVKIWDLSGKGPPRCIRTMDDFGAEITSIAYHPKKPIFATGSYDETVRLWDVNTGEELHTLRGHQGEVMSVAFSPNGKVLVSGGGPGLQQGQVKLWRTTDGELLRTYYGLSDRILTVAVSSKGHIVAGDTDGLVQIWDERRSSEARRFRVDTQPVYALAFHPNGEELATGGSRGAVRLWNSAGGLETYRLNGHSRTEALAYSPDGKLIATAGRSPARAGVSIYLWDAANGKLLQTLPGPALQIRAISFRPDGKQIACAGDDLIVRVYDVDSPQPVSVFNGHSGRIMAVAFHPDGKTIITGSDDHTIRFWDTQTGKETKQWQVDNGTLALTVSRNGRYVATGDYVGKVRVWDLQTNKRQEVHAHKGWVNAVAFSPHGRQVASAGNDQIIHLWDLATSKMHHLEGATRTITGLAYHPKGRRLASVGDDRLVRLWDLSILQEILQLSGPTGELTGVAFHPDGRRLAAAGKHTSIHVWEAAR